MPRALDLSLWLLLLLGAVFGGAIMCGAFFVLYATADQIQEMVRWRRLEMQSQPSA